MLHDNLYCHLIPLRHVRKRCPSRSADITIKSMTFSSFPIEFHGKIEAIAAAAHFESTMKQGNKDASDKCCNVREANEREGHRSSPMQSDADHKIVPLFFRCCRTSSTLRHGIVTWTCWFNEVHQDWVRGMWRSFWIKMIKEKEGFTCIVALSAVMKLALRSFYVAKAFILRFMADYKARAQELRLQQREWKDCEAVCLDGCTGKFVTDDAFDFIWQDEFLVWLERLAYSVLGMEKGILEIMGKTMQISSNISSSGMALGWPTRSCCCQSVHENPWDFRRGQV